MAGAARVLSRRTLDETSTNEIAETAGVSIGSLYQYFRNKQALVTALVRARAEADVDAMTKFLDVPHDVPLDDAVQRAAAELVALHRATTSRARTSSANGDRIAIPSVRSPRFVRRRAVMYSS